MTAIRSINSNEVELTTVHPATGAYINESFRAWPDNYIIRADGRQVCERLDTRGPTLKLAKGDRLIDIIRREYRRWRNAEIAAYRPR